MAASAAVSGPKPVKMAAAGARATGSPPSCMTEAGVPRSRLQRDKVRGVVAGGDDGSLTLYSPSALVMPSPRGPRPPKKRDDTNQDIGTEAPRLLTAWVQGVKVEAVGSRRMIPGDITGLVAGQGEGGADSEHGLSSHLILVG